MRSFLTSLCTFITIINAYSQNNHHRLIIGTYTNSCASNGIYVYDFDSQTANSKQLASTDKVINPSYLAVDKSNELVYSVNENGPESKVSTFKYDSNSGNMKLINLQNSIGADPCYILNDKINVLVANYSGGSISVFKKQQDGSLSEAKQVVQHYGKGTNLKRQKSPHVHMVQFSPDRQFVFANDLGVDKLYIYNYNPNSEDEILIIKDSVSVKPGSGPRHLTFSPNGEFVYLLQELNGGLTVFSYNSGNLKKIQETSLVPPAFKGETSAADIHISSDGNFLYASNRGTANDITCFKIQKDGTLLFLSRTKTLGKGPRNFTIDPSGNYLLVANQYTNEVVIFIRNNFTGALADSGKRISLCSPVCLVFTP
jgi:6-phosphogluconolactonase